jgi:hypothetical protein
MNDRNKHKVTGQMNHQTANPKANASVFLILKHLLPLHYQSKGWSISPDLVVSFNGIYT